MRILTFVLLVVLLVPSVLSAQNSLSNSNTLVIATYQYGDNPRIQNIAPAATHIGEIVGINTVVKSYPSVQLLLQERWMWPS
jgi:hypothetical protein